MLIVFLLLLLGGGGFGLFFHWMCGLEGAI